MCICYVYCCSSYTRPCHRARSALRNVFSTKGCTRCIGCGGRGRGALGSAARRPLRRCRRRGSDSGEVGVTGPAAALTCSALPPGPPSSLTKAKCDGSRRRAMPRVSPPGCCGLCMGVLQAVHVGASGRLGAPGCVQGGGRAHVWRGACLWIPVCVRARPRPGAILRRRYVGGAVLVEHVLWLRCRHAVCGYRVVVLQGDGGGEAGGTAKEASRSRTRADIVQWCGGNRVRLGGRTFAVPMGLPAGLHESLSR